MYPEYFFSCDYGTMKILARRILLVFGSENYVFVDDLCWCWVLKYIDHLDWYSVVDFIWTTLDGFYTTLKHFQVIITDFKLFKVSITLKEPVPTFPTFSKSAKMVFWKFVFSFYWSISLSIKNEYLYCYSYVMDIKQSLLFAYVLYDGEALYHFCGNL